ncbi:zinc finger protein-like isoform X2 [Bradysia coprophila]|uniref:zinc finger protein-like isoform X2 n=1 Tax=Bradysia coprophila TaxID=38358 RepID=UPI00187D95C8|nr:zinc finger protein-like isoform X2 [Bradysia coprophila]
MDLSPIQRCRLCLKINDDVVNIWDTFQDSSIASIVAKHFWFQVNKGDGLTEFICDVCWIQTKTFHQFYKQIEQFQKCFYDSVARDKRADDDAITYADCEDKVEETDVNIVKCEETELRAEAVDPQPSACNYSEYDEIEIESEPEQSDDEEERRSNKGQKVADKKASPRAGKYKPRLSPSEKAKLQEQIRDQFKMNCEICSDVKFMTLVDVHQHYRNVHQQNGYLMCCGKKFSTNATVAEHIRHHNDLKTNGEPEEEAQIREWFAMKCDICSETVEFRTLLEMRRHFRKVHDMRGYLRGTCCSKKLYTRAHMLNHIRWHTNSDSLRCRQCDKIFTRISTLRIHMANYHTPRDSRAFKCTLCPSKFALAALLRAHVSTNHTAKTGESFDCDKCTKSFRSSLLLSLHIRNIHESTTEYVCEICARTFKTKTTLQSHFDYFHSSKPPPKVQCDVCGVRLRSLRYHRQLHEHPDPVNCSICNRKLANQNALRSHISHVHGEKKHQCQLCNKAFKLRLNLQEHLATHTGEDLYNCPYCEKKFKSSGNFHNHKKVAHFAQWSRDSKPQTKRNSAMKKKPVPDVTE